MGLVLAGTLAVVAAADVRLAALLTPRISRILVGALVLALTAIARTEWTVAANVVVVVRGGVALASSACRLSATAAFSRHIKTAPSILAAKVVKGFIHDLTFAGSDNNLTVGMTESIAIRVLDQEPVSAGT